MKVMFLIPHLADGGAERVGSELSRALPIRNLVLVLFESKVDYPFEGKMLSLDMPIRRGSVLVRASDFIRRGWRLRRILRKEHPDTVVSFMGEANILNCLLGRRPIVTVHNHLSSTAELRQAGGRSPAAKARLWIEVFAAKWLVRLLYHKATVVTVSRAVREEMIKWFRVPERQVVVIPNAINSVEIRAKASEPLPSTWKSDVPVILTAGRLTLHKGQWHLLRAFAEVRKSVPCRLAILGAGELETNLRTLANNLGVAKDVEFLGWQQNPWKFMARSDLFVLPSISEGFGLVILEAMACGLPVIATDSPGGSRDIVAPEISANEAIERTVYAEYGVLIPPLTLGTIEVDHLSEAIQRLLQDTEMRQRYIAAGRGRVGAFSHASFVDSYQRLIEKTCQPSAS